ncbi:MAG TPA: AraC family transcriptional regulator ligand-binding domain-containing protein [Roseiarcus sp.]|nr:AraC family transcriptional regulator ligand-binding domain-containing protein [Roseiarcus sp.]
MTEETGRQILPSATGFAARQAIAVLRKHNLPIAPLLNRAGVSEDDIDNRQRRISALAQGKLLEYAGEALGDDVFGLHLAQQANPREVGLLFYVASAADDIGDALALTARYSRIVNEAARLKLIRSPEGVIAQTKFVGLPRHFAWQNTEFTIAALIKGFAGNGRPRLSANAGDVHPCAQLGVARVRTLLRLPRRVQRVSRSVRPFE